LTPTLDVGMDFMRQVGLFVDLHRLEVFCAVPSESVG
jgi:hypothetical protein